MMDWMGSIRPMKSATDQVSVAAGQRSASGNNGQGSRVTGRFVLFAMLGIFAVNLLLRIFYVRYQFVNGDEAVRALTALGVLRGDRLYVDIITDKPPGTTLFYAGVLSFFNHNMAAVHIAVILWNFLTATAVYILGARFYSRKTGLWAALLFVYFSASYHTQDAMAANTELLMTLPYVLSCYCYLRGSSSTGWMYAVRSGSRSAPTAVARTGSSMDWVWLVAAGVFAGTAAAFKQVGLLLLVFFALNEVLGAIADHRTGGLSTRDDAGVKAGSDDGRRVEWDGRRVGFGVIGILGRLGLIAVGMGLIAFVLIVWLWGSGAMAGFWR